MLLITPVRTGTLKEKKTPQKIQPIDAGIILGDFLFLGLSLEFEKF